MYIYQVTVIGSDTANDICEVANTAYTGNNGLDALKAVLKGDDKVKIPIAVQFLVWRNGELVTKHCYSYRKASGVSNISAAASVNRVIDKYNNAASKLWITFLKTVVIVNLLLILSKLIIK